LRLGILGTRDLILGTRDLILGTRDLILGTRDLILGTRDLIFPQNIDLELHLSLFVQHLYYSLC
jgi:hypothetical protein